MLSLFVLAFIAAAAAGPVPSIFDPPPNGGQNFAVLVAGSQTWSNYRHQADVCHAYQVLIEHGFNPDNIIVFMVDDIAQNAQNPTKGIIINQPNGPDVYKGVRKDYTGLSQVTPLHFLNVIKGNAAAMKGIGSGRVLTSGPNDNVFINFVDHGGPGIIAFPTEMLQATDLIAALKYMNTNKMYNQLVFYLEACESGSMFDGLLPANINIFATTASTPTTSSYAIYFDQARGTYLGDVYSVVWMQNSDTADLKTETLAAQYEFTKKNTNTSVVCEYGTMSMGSDPAGQFLGMGGKPSLAVRPMPTFDLSDAISSRDVPVGILENRINAAEGAERRALQAEMVQLIKRREEIRATYLAIATLADGYENAVEHLAARVAPKNLECLDACTSAFHKACFNFGIEEYALEHAKSLTSMCESGVPTAVILDAIHTVCPRPSLVFAM